MNENEKGNEINNKWYFISSNLYRDSNSISYPDYGLNTVGIREIHKLNILLQPYEEERGKRPLIMNRSGPNNEGGSRLLDAAENEANDGGGHGHLDFDDYMFHLRDAVVLVSTQPMFMVSMSSSSSSSSSCEEETTGCIEDVESHENSMTVVRLIIEDEKPAPLPPDYEAMATRIQSVVRRRIRLRNVATSPFLFF